MVEQGSARCVGVTRDGSPCNAKPRPGADSCPWHDEALAARRAEWSRRGGIGRSNKRRAAKAMPAAMTPADLQSLLGVVLRGVVAGKIEPGVGNAAANLGRAIVAVREATTTEERLAALESAAGVGTERRTA
ncbi:MAG: hypothetical protein M3Q10_13780 [Chloroflexota bacterium]|nr:hypothetical protein [Chloroflexota bacterium]